MKKKTLITVLVATLIPMLSIYCQPSSYSEAEWEAYFSNRIQDLDPIEGIWDFSQKCGTPNCLASESKSYRRYIYKSGKTYVITAGNIEQDKRLGTVRFFRKTSIPDVYLSQEDHYGEKVTAKAFLANKVLLEWTVVYPEFYHPSIGTIKSETYKNTCIKLFPKLEDYNQKQKSSGTGFAISSNGIIVTNYHVIDGANTIKVRGINSDFHKVYSAKILMSDKNNDLALIQIDDYSFTSLGTIPYVVKTNLGGVGENVFVLGYPLRATMGDEIKLTNGIVSSRTGFQGDVTSYQISAPVQPGNSGGPLFDSQGNLIGIINAKHASAENASYAIKASYLINLIDLLANPPKLQPISLLSGKSLIQQVELAKKIVYIIEVE